MKPREWWPAWAGQPAVIVAGGESARDAGIEQVRGRARVVAINNAGLSAERLKLHSPGIEPLCPWADALYAADLRWWDCMGGAPEFGGLKIAADHRAIAMRWGVKPLVVAKTDRPEFGEREDVGRLGGQSGGQALNWLVRLRCNPIILVGFDAIGCHWHGPHTGRLAGPDAKAIAKLLNAWRAELDAAAPAFAEHGAEIINASPVSALTAYPKMSLAEALDVRRAA